MNDEDSDLTPREGQEYGAQYSCGVCDAQPAPFGIGTLYRVREEPSHWWMGLLEDANAHYLCNDCKDQGYDVRPLMEAPTT
ncbi:hypothetical protein MW290_04805 [Aquincola tertiaricarbonis]|uniref:Small CPxCG-related zinc finger protein n=1 Tax=Aquincola tertiaricarbonis TaxID=391953 RepID=A0ABY4S867_AQUTE|nr:hypothetical protein [Aquincola tertiaricarbonis]URI07908.1 hypothetical protein MW290_04805 [Aquincola tertiaricarbonis]